MQIKKLNLLETVSNVWILLAPAFFRRSWLLSAMCCAAVFGCVADEMDPLRFRIQGDLLIWKAEEDNLEYAIKITEPRTNPISNTGKGSYKVGNPDWDLGLKLGFFYQTYYDDWDLGVEWVRFHPEATKSHTSTHDSLNKPIYMLLAGGSTRVNGPITGGASAASSKWDLDYDTLDLKLSRQFCVAKSLSVRPAIGLQSAWINQDLHVNYYGVPTFGVPPINRLSYRFHNDFWGIGLHAGAETLWHLTSRFGLYGNASGSLLWGLFKVKQDGSGDYFGGPNASPLTHIKDSYHTVQGSIDLEAGFQWVVISSRKRCEVMVRAGWEQLIWFNQNQLMNGANIFTLDTNTLHGDLGLSGFVLGIEIKF